MTDFYTLAQDLQECKNDKQLLKVAQDIMKNKAKYGLDEDQINKLEQIGIRRYDQLERERQFMFRNKKWGN